MVTRTLHAHNVLVTMHPLQMFDEVEFIAHDDVVQPRSKIERGGGGQQAAAEHYFFPAHHNSIVALLGVFQIDVGSQLPQYGMMLAFKAYEDKASHEVFFLHQATLRERGGRHTQDPLCPFSHFESLALEFLSYSVARLGHSRHSRSKYKYTSNSCPTRPKWIS
ncbi:hypothetical protein PRIC2_009888 [Phytophthora ramorum]|uniref:uncharacterized protein n=1 Tax=Phytophthora ramorum TaxID=164328 RepID=UPI0030B0FD07|nr:hypothetical protein KRP23_10905 [Phytophthora ramorum]